MGAGTGAGGYRRALRLGPCLAAGSPSSRSCPVCCSQARAAAATRRSRTRRSSRRPVVRCRRLLRRRPTLPWPRARRWCGSTHRPRSPAGRLRDGPGHLHDDRPDRRRLRGRRQAGGRRCGRADQRRVHRRACRATATYTRSCSSEVDRPVRPSRRKQWSRGPRNVQSWTLVRHSPCWGSVPARP